jgi:pyruvate/2-oxoglutarate dehydrogenase complex dihydrolipoamide acyltransferase (E2) component
MSEEINNKASAGELTVRGEPYDWDHCTIRFSITFLPGDGIESGRQVILGCNTHSDPPLIETIRKAELGELPLAITGLLDRLRQRLPQQSAEAESKRQAEIAADRARQKAEERIKAAQQRYLAKNSDQQSDQQKPASPQQERAATETGVSLETINDVSPNAEGRQQQTLFG